ncbi:MAG: T9SS type A sorting domain-containing protein [Bacteroidia bacterium]
MKIPAILFCIITCSVSIYAQPVLTYTDVAPHNYDSYAVGHSGYCYLGTSGINQIWNFGTAPIATTETYTIVPTSTVGVASYYPNSTQALSNGGYTMLDVTPAGYFRYGGTLTPGTPRFIYTDAEKMLAFPMNYGDSYTDAFEGQNYSGPEYRTATVYASYIGYGTITTPYNTYSNAICITSHYETLDSAQSAWGAHCSADYYYWFVASCRYPVAFSWNEPSSATCGATSQGTLFLQSITIGENELSQYDFRMEIFPNPFSSSFTLKTPNGKQGDIFNVTDLEGRIVKTFEWNAQEMHVDLSALENGIYMIRLNNGRGKQIVKSTN